MTLSNKDLGIYLKNLRDNKHLSTREVYELCGVSNSYLSLVENGHRRASAIVLKKLAPIYNVDYLDLYEKAGYIDLIEEEQKKKYKTDELGNAVISIDLLGTIKAGYDWIANEEKIGTIDIPTELAKTGDFFALKVKGDSMADAILEGDIVIIKKQNDCESGEIAAVLINGNEVTLKRVKKTDSGILLQALNNKYEPLLFTFEEMKTIPVEIIGILKKQEREW